MTQANPSTTSGQAPEPTPDIPPDKVFNLDDYLPEETIQILREVRNQRLLKDAE